MLLVATKCEGEAGEDCAFEASSAETHGSAHWPEPSLVPEAPRLGLGPPTLVSAEDNVGFGDLARLVLPHIREAPARTTAAAEMKA